MSLSFHRRATLILGGLLLMAGVITSRMAWPRVPDDFNAAAWFDAIARGDTAYVKAELARGVSPSVQRADGWSSLRVAVSTGRHSIVCVLLADGASLEAVSAEVVPPLLHLAVYRRDPVLARQLLEAGADPADRDTEGRDAFDLAALRHDILLMAELAVASPDLAERARHWWAGVKEAGQATDLRSWQYLLGRLAEQAGPRAESQLRAEGHYRKAGRLAAARYRRLLLYLDTDSPLYNLAAAQSLVEQVTGWHVLQYYAEAGDPLARFLASLRRRGWRDEDPQRGREKIETIIAMARQGQPLAQYELATHVRRYYPEFDEAQLDAMRKKWLEAAAEQGHPHALRERGWLHARAGRVEEAMADLQKAADGGLRDEYVEVADALARGRRGLPEDPARAVAWYKRAAAAGDRSAILRLVEAYERGELGLTPDPDEAEHYRMLMKDRKTRMRALVHAIHSRDKALLESNLSNMKVTDGAVQEAWLLAARLGASTLLESFLKAGLDVDTRHIGRTALIIAASSGQTETVEWLLTQGAEPDLAGVLDSPLSAAAAAGHCALIEVLLDKGAEIDARVNGRSALHAAVAHGRRSCAEALLARGADPRLTDQEGRDALALARACGDHAMQLLLLEQAGLGLDPKTLAAERQRITQEKHAAARMASWRRGELLIRLDAEGRPLPQQKGSFTDAPWVCVRDEVSGLSWVIKDDSGGPNDKDLTFRHPRHEGRCDRATCTVDAYIRWLREQQVCGLKDWRVPGQDDLATLGYAQLGRGFPHWPGFSIWTRDDGKLAITWASGLLGKHTSIISMSTVAHVLAVRGQRQELPEPPKVHFSTIEFDGNNVYLRPARY